MSVWHVRGRKGLVAIAAVGLDTMLFTSLGDASNAHSFALVKHPAPALVVAAALPMVAGLLVRRRWPVLAAIGLSSYAAALTLTIGSRPLVTLLLALYGATATSSMARSLVCLMATFVAHGVTVAYEVTIERSSVATIVATATVFALFDLAAWSFGVRTAAGQQRERHLVATREQLAREAVGAERLRIARELHDIVANAVTVITIQAASARLWVRREPERVEEALTSIEQMSRQAVAEMQRLLTVLRAVADRSEPRTATPRLADLEALTHQLETDKVEICLSLPHDLGALDPSVDLAAYRVVQEALTNVTRHAGSGTHAEVQLQRRDGHLLVQVIDDGGHPSPSVPHKLSSGFGLVGLRERVSLLGGHLETGSLQAGGWRVLARLPVEPQVTS